MNRFVKGIILLSIAAFFAECLEFVVNMILARELGEHGMGLYMSILPTIFLIIVIASLELPISISKFIAESNQKLHESMLRHAFRMTAVFTAFSTAAASVALPFIPVFDTYHPFIKGIVIGLIPVVAFTSIARGYFMGVQQMGKIAVANVLKKSFKCFVCLSFFNGTLLKLIWPCSFRYLCWSQAMLWCSFTCIRSLFWRGGRFPAISTFIFAGKTCGNASWPYPSRQRDFVYFMR